MALWPSVMRVIPLKCTRLLLLAYTSPSVVFSPHRTVFEAGHISHYFSISTFKRFEPVDYIKSKFRGKLDSLWRHNSWRHQIVVPWSSGSQESTNLGHVVVCVALLCVFVAHFGGHTSPYSGASRPFSPRRSVDQPGQTISDLVFCLDWRSSSGSN